MRSISRYSKRSRSKFNSMTSENSQESARSRSRGRSITFSSSMTAGNQKYQPEFNIKAANNELHEIIRFMEINPQRAMSNLRSLIVRMSDSEVKKKWLSAWVDYRGLDLLQCAIISDKPNVITYLLRETQLFPRTHFPKTNPYAHMAAMLGYKDSLDALLTVRPDDYFAASEPHHIVKLPPDVMRRLKLGTETGMLNKALEKVVRVVRQENAAAERRIQKWASVNEQTFENEMKDLENSFKGDIETPRKRIHYDSLKPILTFSDKIRPGVERQQENYSGIQKQKKVTESKVTVFMDVFNDDTLDKTKCINKVELPSITALPNDDLRHTNIQKTISSPNAMKSWPGEYKRRLPLISSQRKTVTSISSKIELGVRTIKKYKDFFPVLDSKPAFIEDPQKYMGKTPLTMAAEKNHFDCVSYLLRRFQITRGMQSSSKDTLTLAAKARSPEALALLLKSNVTQSDYQSAVLMSLRELYPDSLNVLLNLGGKNRTSLFEGTNLFHTLYTQSIQADYQYERLPEMTRVLIQCNEEVNSRFPPKTYPLYTLIQSAFNVDIGEKSSYFLSCLKMLLNARANPNYDEVVKRPTKRIERRNSLNIQRPGFISAIHCIFSSADLALDRFEVSYWSQVILQQFIEAVVRYDKTPRRVSNDLLFLYMSYVCRLGLNRRVLRTLLRYGANPDHKIDGRYPLNIFFDEMLPFLTRFEVKRKYQTYDYMLDTLLLLCRSMTQKCLHDAVIYFLDNNLFSTPIQALGLTRKFCYYANIMVTSPRSLRDISVQLIWVTCGRNSKRVADLPLHGDLIQMIIP